MHKILAALTLGSLLALAQSAQATPLHPCQTLDALAKGRGGVIVPEKGRGGIIVPDKGRGGVIVPEKGRGGVIVND